MRLLRVVTLLVLSAMLVLACGAGNTAGDSSAEPFSQASAEASSDGNGNGNGAGNTANGSVQFELTGAATKSGELAALPEMSVFEPNGENSAYLVFINAGNTASLNIAISPNGNVVSYVDGDLGAVLLPLSDGTIGECTIDIDEIDGDSARGSFECQHLAIIEGGETILGEGTLKGDFDSHK